MNHFLNGFIRVMCIAADRKAYRRFGDREGEGNIRCVVIGCPNIICLVLECRGDRLLARIGTLVPSNGIERIFREPIGLLAAGVDKTRSVRRGFRYRLWRDGEGICRRTFFIRSRGCEGRGHLVGSGVCGDGGAGRVACGGDAFIDVRYMCRGGAESESGCLRRVFRIFITIYL